MGVGSGRASSRKVEIRLTEKRLCRKNGTMKTTINLKDDVVRRLKSRAALRGQSLSKFMEDSLEQKLVQDESTGDSVAEWIETLPVVSRSAAEEVDERIEQAAFNKIDPELFV